jgi:DNA-binding NtrC family response regulator
VRQLRNVIERALIVTRGPMISAADLPTEIKPGNGKRSTLDVHVGMSLSAVKRELLLQTLALTGGNKVKAAEILGVSIKTLYNNLKEYQSGEIASDESAHDEESHQE